MCARAAGVLARAAAEGLLSSVQTRICAGHVAPSDCARILRCVGGVWLVFVGVAGVRGCVAGVRGCVAGVVVRVRGVGCRE